MKGEIDAGITAWDDVLSAAAALLESPNGHPLLFLEERADLRIEADLEGIRDVAPTFLRGLSARGGPGGQRHRFVSDPAPDDAGRVARAVRSGEVPRISRQAPGTGDALGIDSREASTTLERLVEATRQRGGRSLLEADARSISFRQRVRIARPGFPVARDLRQGQRFRLQVAVRDGSRAGRAVVDAAVPPGAQPDVDALAEAALRRAVERAAARRAPSGEVPAVYASGAGGVIIHELVGHALEADTVLRSGSLLAAVSGSAVAGPRVEIIDDPRRGRAPWQVDDEGQDARPIALLSAGRVAGMLHDLRTADLRGEVPNGHGRRSSFQEPILPRMGCTYLGAGPFAPEEVLEGIPTGVHVRRMEAASVDLRGGRATFRVTDADLVRNGRLESPLEPFLLVVLSAVKTLSSLDRIASDVSFDACIGSCLRDAQPLAASVGAPTFRTGLTMVVS